MVLRHVSILKDHPQGVCLYLAKVTELFKRFEEFFKFKTLNLKSRWLNPALWQQYCSRCVVTLVVSCMTPQGSQNTPATVLLPQRRI